MRRAVYPGSFDPFTNGHVDLVQRALTVFDEVVVLVAQSGKKTPILSAETRKQLIEQCFSGDKRVSVEVHTGLIVDFCKERNIKSILRGLRAVSDFEYEFQMSTMNHRMYSELHTFLLMASEEYIFLNSTLVREMCAHDGDISQLVPPHVEKALKEAMK